MKNLGEIVNNGFYFAGTKGNKFSWFLPPLLSSDTLIKRNLFKTANNLFHNFKLVLQLEHPDFHIRQQNFPSMTHSLFLLFAIYHSFPFIISAKIIEVFFLNVAIFISLFFAEDSSTECSIQICSLDLTDNKITNSHIYYIIHIEKIKINL